jgi:5-methyltetrahydrofolate--homocysteine methyltransferase
VKIDPVYSGPVVHVLDASKSVPVAQSLISVDQREGTQAKIKADYEQFRIDYKNRKKDKNFISLAKAREHQFKVEFDNIVEPSFLGTKVFDDFPLDELRERIDWTPFFLTWELVGKYPRIFDDKIIGVEAKKLFDDANRMLDEVISKKLLKAKGVIGFYRANAVGDDVVVETYHDTSHTATTQENKSETTFHFLRQQHEKAANQPYLCLSDFVAQKDSGKQDYLGMFAVTAGIGIEPLIEAYEKDHDDYNSIMIKAIADRLAEAFAEKMHELVRKEYWGFAKDEQLTDEEIIREKYNSIRPAPGYPACPDHTEKRKLFDLLNAEEATSITLTESYAMYPTAAVSGFYFANPGSKYFAVGKIDKDQVEEYAKRKNVSVEYVEKWLSPYLAYDN